MGICIGMRNYLLKHSLSKKKPNELKLTVHTSGESLIEMDPGYVGEGQNLGEYSLCQDHHIRHVLWGLVRVLDRELTKPWVLVAGLPSTSTHPPTFPPHLHVFLMGVGSGGFS